MSTKADQSHTTLAVRAEPVQQRCCHGVHAVVVDEIEQAAPPRLAADEDVGGDVQIVEQVEFLVHEGDSRLHAVGDGE